MAKKKAEVIETGGSRAKEMINMINSALGQNDRVLTADDELYRAGYWPTGLLPIDVVTGGGVARGRMFFTAGESQTLKSLIGLATIAQVQRLGGTAALIDTEHSFHQDWALALGINLSELILIQPEIGEEAVDQMDVMVTNEIDFICFDSIAAILTRSERELQLSGNSHNQPANIARLMSLALRKLTSANRKTSILWITQMRDNIGAMPASPKSIKTGGKAMDYYASQTLTLRKTGKITEDITYFDGEKANATAKRQVAQKFRAELLKSRNKAPFDIQHFVFDYVSGKIDTASFLIGQGLDMGLITQSGRFWTYTDLNAETGEVNEEHKAGSKADFSRLVNDNAEVYNSLVYKVCEKYNLDPEVYYKAVAVEEVAA